MKIPQPPTLSALSQHYVLGILIFIGFLVVLGNFYFPTLPEWTAKSVALIIGAYLAPHLVLAVLLHRWSRGVGTGYIVGMLATILLMGLFAIEIYFHPLEIYL